MACLRHTIDGVSNGGIRAATFHWVPRGVFGGLCAITHTQCAAAELPSSTFTKFATTFETTWDRLVQC